MDQTWVEYMFAIKNSLAHLESNFNFESWVKLRGSPRSIPKRLR